MISKIAFYFFGKPFSGGWVCWNNFCDGPRLQPPWQKLRKQIHPPLKGGFFDLFFILLFFVLTSCAIKQPPLPKTSLSGQALESMKDENDYWIEIQIPQRQILLAKGAKLLKSFPVAVGHPSFPTPVGRRLITYVVWNPWWYPPKTSNWVTDPTPIPPRTSANPLGEIKMPLGKLYLVHGTSVPSSIGTWASHGCIRMLDEDMFTLVERIMDSNSSISAIESMEKANQSPSQEFTTGLKRSIPVILTYHIVKIHDGYVTVYPDLYQREKNRTSHIAEQLKPFLKKDQEPSSKKIKNAIHLSRGQTFHVSLDSLTQIKKSESIQEEPQQKPQQIAKEKSSVEMAKSTPVVKPKVVYRKKVRTEVIKDVKAEVGRN